MNKKFLYVLFVAFISVFMLVGCGGTSTVSIKINNDNEMNVGDKVALNVTLENASASDIVVVSSDESIVKYENNELVALKAGSATITVSVSDVEAKLTITVKESTVKVSMTYELNGGTCEGLANERGTETITLPTPTKEGASFDGWYASADFSGEKVTELNASNISVTKLYAKWAEKTYKVVYNFTDASGKKTTEEVVVEWKKEYTVATKTVGSSEVFSGWYKEEDLLNEVTKLAASSVEEEVLNLYGKAIDSSTKFNVTFDYNGGSTVYASREEVIAEFLKDYNYINGKSFTNPKQIGTTSTGPGTFHTFYTATTEDGTSCTEKWGWLYRYVYDLSVTKLDSANYCVTGLKALVISNKETLSDNEKKGISCAIRAFLDGLRIGTGQLQTVDFTKYNEQNGFWSYLSSIENATASVTAANANLPSPDKEGFEFVGWFRDAEGTQGPVKNVYSDCKLYAKYDENNPVEEITINKKPGTILKFKTLQLEWTLSPSDATVRNVVFSSSDESIATVTQDGLITCVGAGKVTIKLMSKSQSGEYDEYQFEVYTPDFIDASYDTVSYVTVGETIKLNAVPQGLTASTQKVVWSSADETIATVNNGIVTGVKDGFVKIKAAIEGAETTNYFEFGVTVLDQNASEVKKFIASQNEGNIFTSYNLGIGAGTPVYYMDILGSVNKLLFNYNYTIDRQYEATQAAISSNHGGVKTSTEFIVVHYTGNMNATATAKANANYFASGGNGTSIHYVTGNDGIYHCLADNLVGFHAGDSTDVTFEWIPSGVMVKEGDPEYPVFEISENSKYIINGQETTIDVPTGNAAKSPNTVRVTGNTFMYNGVEQNCINDMGLPFTIVNGEYYMGTTWWCYTQIAAGRLCSKGGNLNSIGIESAVNEGSDLWYTWHITAQLVAHLMEENSLDITRVRGHHFWSAKDCPQPMLENDLEIWYHFRDMIEGEYEMLTKYSSNYEFSMVVNESPTNVNSYGRITKQIGNTCQSVNYTVTIKNKTTGQTETITLGGIVESSYEK